VRGEGAGGAQQLVDERSLAVVDVGDDGEVAQGAWHELDRKSKKSRIVRDLRCAVLRRDMLCRATRAVRA
jgi:hypothetical protein